MIHKLLLLGVCVGLSAAVGCGSNRPAPAGTAGAAGTFGNAAGVTGGTAAGTISTGVAGNAAGAGAGTTGGTAGTTGTAGTMATDAGMMPRVTCNATMTSVGMCGTTACPAISPMAPMCTINCCTTTNQCGTLRAVMAGGGGGGMTQCMVPAQPDPRCPDGMRNGTVRKGCCVNNQCGTISPTSMSCRVGGGGGMAPRACDANAADAGGTGG